MMILCDGCGVTFRSDRPKNGKRYCSVPCYTAHSRITHGLTKSSEWTSWRCMKARCNQVNREHHREHYRGKGIRVCARWDADFIPFLEDMGPKPTRKHTIDRLDNDRGYDCGKCDDCAARGAVLNCRWASPKEQSNNRGVVRNYTIDGRTQCIKAWAEERGMEMGTVYQRLDRGWPIERALMPGKHRLHVVSAGDMARAANLVASGKSLRAAERETGVPRHAIAQHLKVA